MRVVKLSSIILLAILLALGIPYLGYVLYQRMHRPSESPLSAVPDKSAFIIKINHPLDLFGELNRSNLVWKELSTYPGISAVKDELRMLDSVSRMNKSFRNIFKDNPVYVALSLSGRAEFGIVYLVSLPVSDPESEIGNFFTETYPGKATLLSTPYSTTHILQVHLPGKKNPLYFATSKGVGIMSTHPDLVKKSIDKLSLNTPSANTAGFNSVESVAGKKTDANIYINIPYFTLAVWKTVSETEKDNLVRYARFADWSGLDLLVKKDELLLTGYTSITDSTFHTLALFAHQAPQKMDAVTILPDNVNSFTLFGFENFGMFLKRAVYDSPESPGTVNHLAPFNRRYDLNAESWFLPWIGSQLGNATTEPEGNTENVITYTFIQTGFPDSARRSLVSLAAKLGRKTDTSNFKGYPIVETSLKDALGAVFGNLFRNVNGECFTIIGNFVIFADRKEDLKDLVDHFISGTTLAMQKSYIELSDDISEKSNIYFYCRPGKALNQSPSLFSEPIHKSMQPWLDSLAKFETLTLQFSYNEGRYYTDLSLRFNPNPRDEGPLAWESTLDTLMAGSPQIIARDIKGTAGIIVTDTLNNIYLFDAAGNRLWKQKLYGRILGSVIPVELIDDDSLYYMFNTANHLYLVRSDGETAEKFPMKFPVQASNGVTLTDYNNNGDFRIIIAFKDNRVYNFTIDGTQAEGWVRPQMENEILKPVQYLEYDHKDYLFITDVKGNTMITDRRGTQRIKPVRPVITGENTQFFLNKTARKGPFLTTDHTGKIIFIQENGKISASTVNQFTPGYTFSYEDLKGESSPDFIFFDKNTLYYYDKLMKLTYSYKFLHDVGEPRIIRTLSGKVYIGVISGKGRDIFIFDRNGLVETEPSIRGTTPFDMGNITGKTELNLVIGAGLKLKMYRLTQF